MAATSDWAWVPRNLLFSILDCIIENPDIVRFGSVCKRWRSIGQEAYDPNKLSPMLLIPTKDNNKEKRSLSTITQRATFDITLPQPYNNRFFGSSHGWLFTIDESSPVITLINPFSNRTIHLPEFKDPHLDNDGHEYCIYKGILSCDPCSNPNNYQVAVIYVLNSDTKLAFLNSSKETWRFIKMQTDCNFADVLYSKGQLYAVSSWGELVNVDISSTGNNHRLIVEKKDHLANKVYIVESQEGHLLLVQIFDHNYNPMHWGIMNFEVSTLVNATSSTNEKAEWVPVESLNDEILFLGGNHSVSRSVSSIPSTTFPIGFRHNCIYLTDNFSPDGFYIPCGVDNIFSDRLCIAHGVKSNITELRLEYRRNGMQFVLRTSKYGRFPAIWIAPNLYDQLGF